MSNRKAVVFALAAVALSTTITVGALFALDYSLHKRYEASAGLNTRGYRGQIVGRKQPGERRVVVLGGSTAFGYGVHADESFPAYLQELLRHRSDPGHAVTVINLAYNNEGAYSFRPTLDDYAYLHYDSVILYEGYNDVDPVLNRRIYRHRSPVFRLTGYLPILPVVAREKLMAMKYGGHLDQAYAGDRPTFRPSLAQRAVIAGGEGTLRAHEAFREWLTRLDREPVAPGGSAPSGCGATWDFYCQNVAAAVDDALAKGARVMVVTQPYASQRHREQQAALRGLLARRFGGDSRVTYVDVGDHIVDLNDPAICYDGVHLTAAGNRLVAQRLADPAFASLGDASDAARTVRAVHGPNPS